MHQAVELCRVKFYTWIGWSDELRWSINSCPGRASRAWSFLNSKHFTQCQWPHPESVFRWSRSVRPIWYSGFPYLSTRLTYRFSRSRCRSFGIRCFVLLISFRSAGLKLWWGSLCSAWCGCRAFWSKGRWSACRWTPENTDCRWKKNCFSLRSLFCILARSTRCIWLCSSPS